MTRRLVDVSNVIITEDDCGTLRGIKMEALKDNEDIIEQLEDRIIGRFSLHDIYDPISNDLICEANQMIDGAKIAGHLSSSRYPFGSAKQVEVSALNVMVVI